MVNIFFVVAFLVGLSHADKLDNTYLPPQSAQSAGGSGSFLAAPHRSSAAVGGSSFGGSQKSSFSAGNAANTNSFASAASNAAPIAIIRLNNENNGDGSYKFDFETENRISQQETGQLKNEDTNSVQGSYSFVGPDGVTYTINYVADENGFQPIGEHLPTAPPVPAEILKALEQNAADEAAGIVDDGQYRPEASPAAQYSARNPNGGAQSGGYKY